MEWINEPSKDNPVTTDDICIVYVCYARDGDGGCLLRWCVSYVCGWDF